MKVARVTNDKKLLISGEFIEDIEYATTPSYVSGSWLHLDGLNNNTDNIWKDISGNGRDIDVSGILGYGGSWGNDYMQFSGIQHCYTNIPINGFSDFANNQITVSSYVYTEGIGNFRGIFGHHYDGGNGFISQFMDGIIGVGITNSFVSIPATLLANQWVELTVTYNGNENKVYINGVLQGTSSGSWNKTDQFALGRSYDGNDRYFLGKMKNFIMYNKALTDEEVLANYNATNELYNSMNEGLGLIAQISNTGDIKTVELIEDTNFKLINGKIQSSEFIEGVEFNKTFSPTDITNCALWADVETIEGNDGDTVNTLSELVSGNDFNGYGVLNTVGIKSIKFNGSSMATLNDVTPYSNQPRTIIVLGKPYTSGNMFGYGVDNTGQMVDGLLYGGSQFIIHAHGGGYDNIGAAPQFALNEIQAFSIIYDGIAVKTGVNRNISPSTTMQLWTQSTPFIIGTGVYGGYNNFSGAILEVLIYDKALNDTELNTIMDYLGNKRGLLL